MFDRFCLESRTNIPIPSESYRKRHRHSHDAKIKNALKVLKGVGKLFQKFSDKKIFYFEISIIPKKANAVAMQKSQKEALHQRATPQTSYFFTAS